MFSKLCMKGIFRGNIFSGSLFIGLYPTALSGFYWRLTVFNMAILRGDSSSTANLSLP